MPTAGSALADRRRPSLMLFSFPLPDSSTDASTGGGAAFYLHFSVFSARFIFAEKCARV